MKVVPARLARWIPAFLPALAAIGALAARSLVFIIAMKPAGGVFASFAVASVQNPRTRQEVADLAPAEVRKRVVAEAARRWVPFPSGKSSGPERPAHPISPFYAYP